MSASQLPTRPTSRPRRRQKSGFPAAGDVPRPGQAASDSGQTASDSGQAAAGTDALADRDSSAGQTWYRQTWFLGLAGGLLLWAAFAPLGWWPLAWVAPMCWLSLVASRRLAGWRPYVVLWLVSCVHWLLLLQGIRLAHWATYFGWVALSLYLAVYLPAFVGLTRLAVHRLGWPLLLAAPLTWTGLELVRGHLLTGFSLGLLGHTQVAVTPLIQLSDVMGGYGVSFLVMFVSAGIVSSFSGARFSGARFVGRSGIRRLFPAAAAGLALVLAMAYGFFRLATPRADASQPDPLKVALIQRSVETVFEFDPKRNLQTFYDYRELTLEARSRHPDLDLIVWPESVYTANVRELLFEGPMAAPEELAMSDEEFREAIERWRLAFESKNENLAEAVNSLVVDGELRQGNTSLLVGTDVEWIRDGRPHYYNTAMLLDPRGAVAGRYHKMHPVMFGEYVPLGSWFPWLYQLTPLSQGLTPGTAPQSWEVANRRLCPNICFESTVPHLVRRQVRALERQDRSPDVLVSITNDGWFRGSSILDLHLTCAVFRAVENRRPLLVAANTGISAHVDGSGRVRQQVGRLKDGFLVAEIRPDHRGSIYTQTGDLFAGSCLLACVGIVLGALLVGGRPSRGPGRGG